MEIKELFDADFRGNIYLVQNGKVIYESATGFADLANEIPNAIDTKFASASAGKVFVAVGILQLIEQGKIKFEDTLGNLLDMPLNAIDPDVTVRQLLTHTSGVPDYFDESVMEEYEELWADYPNYKIRHNSDLLPLFMDKPMMYPKGEKFQYNNSGYVLLAIILEKMTGMEFDAYLKGQGKLISKALVSEMLKKQSGDGMDAEEGYYGYGVWIIDHPAGKDFAYFQGCDPGVSFLSEYKRDDICFGKQLRR